MPELSDRPPSESALSDRQLLEALGVAVEPAETAERTPDEERIVAGFEEIRRFVQTHDRPPRHGADRDIFERLYAARLDRLRESTEARGILAEGDPDGLLDAPPETATPATGDLDDAALLSELGVAPEDETDIATLEHVRSHEERRAAEEIASRTPCQDFDRFEPLFQNVQKQLDLGARTARRFEKDAEIRLGGLFILGGQKAYVAEMGKMFSNAQGRLDARLRVIFDNGTQSDLLMRSLQRALHKDSAGRRIADPQAGPLFAEPNAASGTVYVLRSKSDHPEIAENRDIVHKIGVTGGSVEQRIASARHEPTFLLADVEIVATYELFNIDRTKLEALIHRIFADVRLDLRIEDRFGQPVTPREWFFAPLSAVDEAIEKIEDGTIADYEYDKETARFRPRQATQKGARQAT